MPSLLIRPVLTCLASAALLLTGCFSENRVERTASLKPDKERRTAPDFTLRDSEGRAVKLSEYRGKVVLLNFWATWCGPCKVEIPWFIEFEQKHKDQGFAVLGIAMDDDGWDVVKPYINARRVNYRVLMGDETVSTLYGGVESLPTSFMIDREGRIANVHIGLVNKRDYQDDIERLLEAGKSSRGGGVVGGLVSNTGWAD